MDPTVTSRNRRVLMTAGTALTSAFLMVGLMTGTAAADPVKPDGCDSVKYCGGISGDPATNGSSIDPCLAGAVAGGAVARSWQAGAATYASCKATGAAGG